MRNDFNVSLLAAFIISLPSPSVRSQSLWQHTSLDAAAITTFATNSHGDIFAGDWLFSNNIYRSTNDGEYWETLNMGYSHPLVACISINRQERIFVGTSLADSARG